MSELSSKSKFPLPTNWQFEGEIFEETIQQVEKDFVLHGLCISLKTASKTYSNLVNTLAELLKELNFIEDSKFAATLYQLDLNESKLIATLQNSKPSDTYFLLANLILKRCFEKVYWRHKMKGE